LDAFALVDYDNLPMAIRNAGLVALAWRIESHVTGIVPTIGDIHIRLYGGWYEVAGLTNSGTILTQEIGRSFPIPITVGGNAARTITCEIGSSLIDSRGEALLFTKRNRRGMRSVLRSQTPRNCISPGTCTINSVVRWSRGSCSFAGCGVATPDAFTYDEQKLTDTLLCADILALARRTPPPPTFVLSNDDDMTPAILLAAKSGAPIFLVRNLANPKFYDGILRQNNVQILTL
jgi:hypothetical protein